MANSTGQRLGCPFKIYASVVEELQGGDCSHCKELLVSSVYEGIQCKFCNLPLRAVKQTVPTLYFITSYRMPRTIIDNVMAVEGLLYKHTFTDMYITEEDALKMLNSLKRKSNIIYRVETAKTCNTEAETL